MDICSEIYKIVCNQLEEILLLRNTKQIKDDNTYVSKADLLIERIILNYLESKLKNFVLISEESYNSIKSLNKTKYIITIDPIDGTENFVSGLKEWGIGISIYKDMKHFQSMIALPELNVKLCTGDKIYKIDKSRLCGLSSYMKMDDFKSLDKNFEYRIMGCCMYNMYNVIKGSYYQFQHMKGAYSWDVLPGFNLALEHGLDVIVGQKEYKGEFLYPNIKYNFIVKQKTI